MQAAVLDGGFRAPATDAAQAFRAIMTAMARPGTIGSVTLAAPPAPLSQAAGAVLLTLCDTDTPIYLAGSLDAPDVRDWIAFHTGAPLTGPSHAMFAFGAWRELQPLSAYPTGRADYPDRSTTLVVELAALTSTGATLSGPGIKDKAQLSLPEIDPFQKNAGLFPLGLDFIFTSGDRLAALPRTTKVS